MALPKHLDEAAAKLEQAASRIEESRAKPVTLESLQEWLVALTDYSMTVSEIHQLNNESIHEKLHELAASAYAPEPPNRLVSVKFEALSWLRPNLTRWRQVHMRGQALVSENFPQLVVRGFMEHGSTASEHSAELVEKLRSHVAYLASPELKGRKPGTPGNRSAAEYIVAQFRDIRLDPLPSLAPILSTFHPPWVTT